MASKKILFVLTSHDKMVSGKPTGWYLPEAAHPYYVVKEAGCAQGGKAPLDPSSVEGFKEDEGCKRALADAEFKKGVENTKKLADMRQGDYAAIFYVGGHGPCFDLSTDLNSHKLIQDFWAAGKPVSAVCHGPVVFCGVTDTKTGEKFVKGKKLTCFSNEEEKIAGLVDEIPFLVETQLRAEGADFQNKREAWKEEIVVDGQLITGANPASAEGVGQALVAALKA
ncbi:hypothetical protein JCM10213_006972 [Rhodosporidiobolus nylandii]